VQARFDETVELLTSLGAEIVEVSCPSFEYALPAYYLIAPSECSSNLARFDGMRYGIRVGDDGDNGVEQVMAKTRAAGFGAEVKRRIMLGTYALSAGYYDAYYGRAQRVRTLIKRDFERVFTEVDAIACPVTPTTAFPIGGHGDDPLSMYLEDVFTLPANLAGVPGLAFPVGFDSDGLPIGMQLNGPALSEALLLRLGDAYQRATDWHRRAPMLDDTRPAAGTSRGLP
jgi:aspartyl-tRNA(Asn)/glutamyl-tRNA(Gln) amidotransferase subunit A